MVQQSSIFPIYIRAVDDGNRSAFDNLERDARNTAKDAERVFNDAFRGVQDTIAKALSIPRNSLGSLDLGVEQYKRAAREADAFAIASREVANAMEATGREAVELTRDERLVAQATRAAAKDAEEYARDLNAQAIAAQRVQEQLNKNKSATDQVVAATRTGTVANRQLVNSTQAVRQATLQAGQQLQDIGISLYSGQRASIVFAQQLPQLAFAMSGLEGQTNKTLKTIGRLGTFLAGPWGLAVGLAVGVAATFIGKLFESGDAADEAGKAHESFTDKLDLEKKGLEDVTLALKEYNAEQDRSRELTIEAAAAKARTIAANIEEAIAIRENTKALLDNIFAQSSLVQSFSGGNPIAQLGAVLGLRRSLNADLAEQDRYIEELRTGAKNAIGEVADEIAKINSDPRYKIEVGFDKLRSDAKESITDIDALAARLEALNKQEAAALEALNAKKKKARKERLPTLPAVTGREVADLLGTSINSGARTKAQNDAVGGSANSHHLLNRKTAAIDIPLTVNGRPLTKEGIRAALEPAGIYIRELLGPGDKDHDDHFHIAFERRRRTPDQVNKGIDRALAAAVKETERLARISDSAAERVLRINEQFDDQPRLVDRSAQAVRKLDAVISELSRKENKNVPRLAELLTAAEEAKVVARNAVADALGREIGAAKDNLRVQRLILAGREEEAEVVERILRMEEQFGVNGRLADLNDTLRLARETLETEDATNEERAAAQAEIKALNPEYERLLGLNKQIYDTATDQVIAEREINEAIQIRNEEIQRYNGFISQTENALKDLLSGNASGGDVLKTFRSAFEKLRGENLFESLLGQGFRDLREFTRRNDPVNVATRELATQTTNAGNAAQTFADAVNEATGRIQAGPQAAANDNPASTTGEDGEIVVTAVRKPVDLSNLTTEQFAERWAKTTVDPFLGKMDEIFGTQFFERMSGAFSGALAGYIRAGEVGAGIGGAKGLVDSISGLLGEQGKSTKALEGISSALGGALDGAETGDQTAQILRSIGIKTSRTGGQLGGAIGSALPIPGGELIGSIIGSLLGGFLKKTPRGAAVITGGDSASISGNKSGIRENLGTLSGSVQESLRAIADRFDADLGSFAVSIGQRKDSFRVSASGSANAGDKKFAKRAGADLIYEGTDAEEAVRVAVLNALQDGAIVGIREGARRLLAAGKDLEKAIEDALTFQDVFDRLDAKRDPVGSALRKLNKEFEGLIDLFTRAGASAEEFADLEELYGIERAELLEQAQEQFTSGLKAFLDELNIGDNGLSLRTRLDNALAEFNPLADQIRAGERVDYDQFESAARDVLEISRQIFGSQDGYFTRFDEINELLRLAIAREEGLFDEAAGIGSPFDPANDNLQVVNAIDAMNDNIANILNGQLGALNGNIIAWFNRGIIPSASGGNISSDPRIIGNNSLF